ncbi:uncharacterized protein B0I36DRAFT_429035 [Microdochium trichocladiopsis]|uniref:G-patch domain-containing protein n=1 Tax=Microdochium trichocladiopsis TaxID=1682393 RepID=A0A9P8YAL2_9PEZI|nr:uncharacterized protein B0I36DRAFT_429035 [Microdochium trichocladiopsis]KAH7034747.1 hypothetical protein B0I36DRAFT_429035 [Microdochium trichocladiopsis]
MPKSAISTLLTTNAGPGDVEPMALHHMLSQVLQTPRRVNALQVKSTLAVADPLVDDVVDLHLAHDALTTIVSYLKASNVITAVQSTVLGSIVKKLETATRDSVLLGHQEEITSVQEEGYEGDDDHTPIETPRLEAAQLKMRPTAKPFTPGKLPCVDATSDNSLHHLFGTAESPASLSKQLVASALAYSDEETPSPSAGGQRGSVDLPMRTRSTYKKITFRKAPPETLSQGPVPATIPPRPDSPITQFLKSKTFDDPDLSGREEALSRGYGFGAKILQQSGWKVGQGLGPTGDGIKVPLIPRRNDTNALSGNDGHRGTVPRGRAIQNTMDSWQQYAAGHREGDKHSLSENEPGQTHADKHETGPGDAEASRLIDDSPESASIAKSGVDTWVSHVAQQRIELQESTDMVRSWVITQESSPDTTEETKTSMLAFGDESGMRQKRASRLHLRPALVPEIPTWELKEEERTKQLYESISLPLPEQGSKTQNRWK